MKNFITNVLAFVVAICLVGGVGELLHSQSSLTVQPGSTLASCPSPVSGSKAMIFCNVAGDGSNPDGAYLSANGSAYVRINSTTGVLPQSVTATAGQCLTGYNATTGAFTTGACLASITKAQVLGTGVAATTSTTSTSTTTLQ